ncbi:hypothetical protein SteCoe_22932 [Stentor coeruleus]|uniref:protein-serine/threonine phosphatase n=1 Tax=Stentor coeruleus TaxID=5963 RepID=A0A1R2BL38_9CILI|nr:hypothetical protein SteCoe_22932 [Stentor coeruleus]
MLKFESNLENKNLDPKGKTSLALFPRIERSYSPSPINRSPNIRVSSSQKMLFPSIKNSRCSSGRNSRLSKGDTMRISTSRCGIIYGYAADSHSGLAHYRKSDCMNTITNLPCPKTISESIWPKSSFFAIYDGHGGKACANFLKEQLHNFILQDQDFPYKAKKAIINSFKRADDKFLTESEENGEMSGSCALVVMFIGNKCIIANTGDSRCVISCMKGTKVKMVTSIHKPSENEEHARIINNGGTLSHDYILTKTGEAVMHGPARVNPGKLLVSRAFGDLDAKCPRIGGNPKVVIVEPDIKSFKITQDFDFLLLGTDSFFEFISNREAVDLIWASFNELKGEDFGVQLNGAMEDLMNDLNRRRQKKNANCMIIAFKNLRENCDEVDN